MTTTYVSNDSFAHALGRAKVQEALTTQGIDCVDVGSYGLAWLEPLIEVDATSGRVAFGPVTSELVPHLATLLNAGTNFEDHPSFLGDIHEHSFLKSQQRLVFRNVGYAALTDIPTYSTLRTLLSREPHDLINELELSGLRGRGGAGFPAHIKWRTVADTPADQRYIVCNADEGDSGTFSDRMLMEGDPDALIEGMAIAGYACGASEGYIYLRSEYPFALHELKRSISRAYEHKLLGKNVFDSEFSFDLQVFVGAGAYICGEETSLLESLEGKRGQIRAKPPLPAIAGLFNKPTLVHNVITLASVPSLFDISGEEYGSLGVAPSCGTIPFQIAGNVKYGGLIELEFGHTVRELVEDYGGGTRSGRPFRTVQIGGPLGAYLSEAELDTPLTYEAMQAIGAGIGHGGLVVFDDTVNLREQAEYAFEFCEIESCGKCTPCRIGSVRGKELVQHLPQASNVDSDIQLIQELCDVMENASLCQMGGMTPIPVRSALERFPEDFR
ncbi:MAG: formate dehydrogenase [Gammaproteobacteria bacterium]|nr:formate dehydrogenase [Gammaproteobacteria bacterium]